MKKLLFVFALMLAGLSPALAQTKVIYAEISETVSGDPSDLTLTFKAVDAGSVPAESFDETTGVGTYSLSTADGPNYTKLRKAPQTDFKLNIKKAVFDSSVADARPTSTRCWFYKLENLESIEDIKYLNTSSVTRMDSMFNGDKNLLSLDVSGFNTSNVTNMYAMFGYCSSLNKLDVSNFDTRKVRTMGAMFLGCSNLANIDVSNFNTNNVTYMAVMFSGCSSLESINVSKFKTGKVTDMSGMFSNCSRLKNIDVSNFNTRNVESMMVMFSSCSALTSIDVSGFNTGKISNINGMFYGCSSLSKLDISKWTLDRNNFVNAVTLNYGIGGFAKNCTSLKELDLGPNDLALVSRGTPQTVDALAGIGNNDKEENLCRITFSFDISRLSQASYNSLIIDKTNPMPPYYNYFGGYFCCAEKLDCDKNLTEDYTPVAKENTDLWQPNRQLTTNDWNTLVVPVALTRAQLEQSFGKDVKVCRLESYSNKVLHFKTVGAGESIPANEPVLVKPAEDINNIGYANVNIEEPTNDLMKTVESGDKSVSLIGTYNSKLTLNYDWLYYSSKWGAFVCSDGTAFIRKTRAYITISGAPVNSLKIAIDDDGVTNDINRIDGEVVGQPEGPAYNLSGQRVGDDYKGIVIVNGKKLLRK